MHIIKPFTRFPAALLALTLCALVVGCASPKHKAPVEERPLGQASNNVSKPAAASAVAEVKPLPGAENAGKPGYYQIKPGDTLIRIALDNGQIWRDLVKWNELENPNRIEVGQVLRVVPPGVDAGAVTTRPIAATKIENRPLDSKSAAAAASAASASANSNGGAATSTAPAAAAAAASGDEDLVWAWPVSNGVSTGFDEVKNKGLGFSGKAGDPVYAAADGRVVYAGSSLRGYGNLVIIKHNLTYLTAYAHNQTLLVKEDQAVRKGQKIAEMGSSDSDQVKLHFEVRKQGKPIDPAKLLPSR